MITKDILRIALFLLVAIFALRSYSRIRVRSSELVNKAETEDTETQPLFQRLHGDNITPEPKLYENKTAGKEN